MLDLLVVNLNTGLNREIVPFKEVGKSKLMWYYHFWDFIKINNQALKIESA